MDDKVVVIGGGLGGLTTAYLLAKGGKKVTVVEKKTYPFHRVCGEYVSNEVKNFLIKENLYPYEHDPINISTFRLSAISGKMVDLPLDLGGFGISRYHFDQFLYEKCLEINVQFLLETQVLDVNYNNKSNLFDVNLSDGTSITSNYVLGAFGKRSKMDKSLSRPFINTRTPYIGVKYHVKTDFPSHIVALHNFEGGYLGINKVAKDTFNICYLGSKHQLKKYGNISEMEKQVLHKNPIISALFHNSDFLFEKPEVINEVNFSSKEPINNHILMIGDASGLITPLCGNGMAIAIHSGKLAAEAILQNKNRNDIERQYVDNWTKNFKTRLRVGRTVQKLFGTNLSSNIAVALLQKSSYIGTQIIKNTHGRIIV
ncbi:NAD(P)/FAD-dependent oxidoreductase [Anditalea andensis]|uniref:FAD-dependent oxidoreductase n=1 Tax=Anditalea andensis TaxID=1048983 RepID=A0A074KZK8_9BACT|nr:NAD(P)/FAD-dependent oxidoreductase [Anditalea andensis]KEO73610.1 FAD-dependent oxidoreductase [Anditalea andensis]